MLAGVTNSTGVPPTNASLTVVNQLAAKLDTEIAKLETIKTTDLPAFNKLVREQEVPAIMVSKKEAGTSR